MASLLRPDPARAVLLAAGAVALTLFVFLLGIRFDEEWGQGIHLVYSALAAALVLALAVGVDRRDDLMPVWHSVLFVTAFFLVLDAVSYLAEVLGADDGAVSSAGTTVWTGLIMLALATFFALRYKSGIAALFAAVTAAVVVLAFIEWVFSPEEVGTFRWVLVIVAVLLGARAWTLRESRPHQANAFAVAAGLALLGITATFLVLAIQVALGGLFGGGSPDFSGPSAGWELVMLVGGAALIAWPYSGGGSGPGYLGALALLGFVGFSATPDPGDDPSLIGWPIVFAIVTAVLLVMALRPAGAPQARSR